MARNDGSAYAATEAAAYRIVEGATASIMEAIKAREVTDSDDLIDRINEEADTACTYTADQYVLVWGLRDVEDAIEEGLCTPQSFSEALAAQAFCNIRAALNDRFDEFVEAMQVAEDAAGEVAP